MWELYSDILTFVRKLRLQYLLHDKPHKTKTPFQPKSKNNPGVTLHDALKTTIEKLSQTHFSKPQTRQDNLTRNERIALNNLSKRTDIVIDKADKGSAVVIINTADYIARGEAHLADKSTYEPLITDITGDLKKFITEKLTKLHKNGLLTTDMFQFCKPPTHHRTSRLYFLQKIHKNPIGIRPIVSSCNSITENISQFIDIWLQPLMKKLPSFLRDTTDSINLIENTKLPNDCILASIDVSSLYTNIPHGEGRTAAVEAILKNDTPIPLQPQPQIVGELIDIVLQNNVFEFNEKFFLQKQGTAMGTKMPPAYANLFMGKL